MSDTPNVLQAVPFFMVADMEASLRFYTEGLGFTMTKSWVPEGKPPQGKIRWCWLRLGSAAIMLQEYNPDRIPSEKRGVGVSICFQCHDAIALYKDFLARGQQPKRPFVGNAMWVTGLADPDGYYLDFESPTDAPEESLYEEIP
jgi:uncharacterized glyoxalase superfamily protein PhnB